MSQFQSLLNKSYEKNTEVFVEGKEGITTPRTTKRSICVVLRSLHLHGWTSDAKLPFLFWVVFLWTGAVFTHWVVVLSSHVPFWVVLLSPSLLWMVLLYLLAFVGRATPAPSIFGLALHATLLAVFLPNPFGGEEGRGEGEGEEWDGVRGRWGERERGTVF